MRVFWIEKAGGASVNEVITDIRGDEIHKVLELDGLVLNSVQVQLRGDTTSPTYDFQELRRAIYLMNAIRAVSPPARGGGLDT